MTSITYTALFSRFYLKVEAYDLLELTQNMRNEFLCGYLHSALSDPYIRRLFSSIVITDPSEELIGNPDYNIALPESETNTPFITQSIDGDITFELKHVNDKQDEIEDIDFITEVIACGIVLAWIEPKVKSLSIIKQGIFTADEKLYSQAAHINELQSLRENCEITRNRLISNRGFIYNDYLEGKSGSSKARGKSQ